MEKTILEVRRRQSRQMRFEEAFKFGIEEASRRHSDNRDAGGNFHLPPILYKPQKKDFLKSRAKSIAVMKLPFDDATIPDFDVEKRIKLPKIGTENRKSSIAHNNHWKLPLRRVSQQNNRIIVEHLRHKLLRQHERRVSRVYEEVRANSGSQHSLDSADSYDQDAVQFLKTYRPRILSISTLNISSRTTSRGAAESILLDSRVTSPQDISSVTLPKPHINMASQIYDDVIKENIKSERQNRPSICVSSETGLTDWIAVDDVTATDIRNHDVATNDVTQQMTSLFQRSITDSERSVAMLIRKARKSSILSDPTKPHPSVNHYDVFNSSANQHDTIKAPVNQRRTSLVNDESTIAEEKPQIENKPQNLLDPKSKDSVHLAENETLFADWKSSSNTSVGSRRGSFLSDLGNAPDDVTMTSLSRQNTFMTDSRSTSPQAMTQEEQPEDLINDMNDIDPILWEQIMKKIYLGDITTTCPKLRRKVIIYICSGGVDTNTERRYLNQILLQKLRNFCRERYLTLDLIDLHHCSEELTPLPLYDITSGREVLSKSTQLELLKNCYENSIGPAVMCFVGDTLGKSPTLPDTLTCPVYDIIIRRLEEELNEVEIQLLQIDSSLIPQEGRSNRSSETQTSANRIKKNSYSSSVVSAACSCTSHSTRTSVHFDLEKQLELKETKEKARRLNDQLKLFKHWYLMDSNSIPCIYRLKQLSSEYKSLETSWAPLTPRDFERRRQECQQWTHVCQRLLEIIYLSGSEKSVMEQLKGVVESELQYILSVPVIRSSESTFWFRREILNSHEDQDSSIIQHFIPFNMMTNQIDNDSTKVVQKLVDDFKETIGHTNMRSYPVPWRQVKHAYGSHDQVKSRDWTLYSERLRLDFYNVCTMQIRNSIEKLKIMSNKFHEEEVYEHVKLLQHLSHDFVGREEILRHIKKYIRSPKNRQPYIIYGPSGCGKSAVLSKAATLTHTWLEKKASHNVLEATESSTKVIFRSIGATGNSLHPHSLLVSLCAQMRTIYAEWESQDSEKVPQTDSDFDFAKMRNLDFLSITKKFQNLLRKCGVKDAPLVIYLDGLQQLLNENGALNLQWLPDKLPRHTKLIISVTGRKETGNTGKKALTKAPSTLDLNKTKEIEKNAVFEVLCLKYLFSEQSSKENRNFLFVPGITSPKDCLKIGDQAVTQISCTNLLTHVLKTKSRTLTSEQMKIALSACKPCETPLGALIFAEIAGKWNSFTELGVCQEQIYDCGSDVESYVHAYFRILEQKHSREIVVAASSFLTCSLHGLSASELQDLLSFDKNVAKYLQSQILADTPQIKPKAQKLKSSKKDKVDLKPLQLKVVKKCSVPGLIWQLFFKDFKFLLHESLSDCILTLKWKHGVYGQVVKSRYIQNEENKKYYHHLMSDYFSDQLPTEYSEITQARPHHCDITGQPLSWQPKHHQNKEDGQEHNTAPLRPVFNIRRLVEGPHHFAQCRTLDQIKSELIFNYEWLLIKIRAGTYEDIMILIGKILRDYPTDADTRLLSSALHLSRSILTSDPCQLASQLIGRLYGIVKKDKPIARLDPRKYPYTRKLLFQCRRSSVPVLLPSNTCLMTPSDVLYDLHAGHCDVITAIAVTTDGQKVLTSSKDGTLKVWELYSGSVTNTLSGVGVITSLCVCMNNNYVVAMDTLLKIKVWCIRTYSCILCMQEYEGPTLTSAAGDMNSLFVIISNSTKLMKVWDMDKIRFLHKIDIAPDFELTEEQTILTGKNSRGNNVLFSFYGTDEAYVYNVKRAKHLNTIKLQTTNKNGSITQVEVSREYYVIMCMRQYMTLHQIVTFELYDAINYGHVRTIKACPDDRVFGIYLNRLGSHIIALCKGVHGTEVGAWNVESGHHQHIAFQNNHSTMGACVDLQYCMTADPNETTLRVHNLALRIDDRAGQSMQKKSQGIGEFYPITHNSRYVVARGSDNGPITVWNITRGQCKGEAVSIERGLQERNDVVIVKDTKVVVLSDRGTSSMEEGSQQIFKTIYIYDLQTKKYVRKLRPVAVTICPSDEYRILGHDRLLGVAQDRSHFILWSLDTGQVIKRIKLDFSKYERAEEVERKNKKKEKRWKRKTGKSFKPEKDRKTDHVSGGTPCHLNSNARSRKIDQILLSGDESILLCSFYGHHVAVLDMETNEHTHTLTNKHSMLLLHQAVITYRGCHLIHTNFDEASKTSYLTVWNLRQGSTVRRLKNEPLVCGLAVSENASRVVFATEDNYLKIWEPFKRGGHRKIPGYEGLNFRKKSGRSPTMVYLMRSSTRAVVFSDDISLWNLEHNYVMCRFTPDVPLKCCSVALNGSLIVVGLSDSPTVVTLRLLSCDLTVDQYGRSVIRDVGKSGIFGEKNEKDSESSEEEL